MAITDVAARTAKPREKEYKLTVSHGLYPLVKPTGSKRWYLKHRFEGKESRVALVAYPLVYLAKAHEKRDEIRLFLAEGISPNAKKEEVREQEQATLNTFEKVAKDWHSNKKRWSSGHAERVWRDLERNILPTIGARNIADLSTRDLFHCVK